MDRMAKKWQAAFIAVWLAAAAFAAYSPLLQNGFVRYDDPEYLTSNPQVLAGLSWAGTKWAFGSSKGGNWHPLTWLSHMLDVQLFGVVPKWHHLVSLFLHAANAVGLFFLLRKLTGAEGRSAFVAGLFALHPLHVESVAWAAERKDTLSTLFLLLTLWAYARFAVARDEATAHARDRAGEPFAQTPNRLCDARALHAPAVAYVTSLVFFALGLMSKPMLVSVPLLLLLLDFWPLKRLRLSRADASSVSLQRLAEKIPFILLAGVSCGVSFWAQAKSNAVSLTLPFSARLDNAVVSYLKYLGKTFWPLNLSAFYPHPETRYPHSEQWAWWWLVISVVGLVGFTGFVIGQRRNRPWLLTGWFWYLGALLPVIGLVQVGLQGMADRYTYIPLIGIFVCIVWGVAEFSARSPGLQNAAMVAGVAGLALCAGLTHRQANFWRSDFTLFEHALAVNPNNAVAQCHVGIAYGEQNQFELAKEHFQAAIAADPSCVDAYYGLGFTLENQGNLSGAVDQYREALRMNPAYEPAHARLGNCLWSLGKRDQAMEEYQISLRLRPNPQGYFALGQLQLQQGDSLGAATSYRQALRLRPDWLEAMSNLAWLLSTAPQPEARNGAEAVRLAERALAIDGGKDARVYGSLAAAYAEVGRFSDAVATAQKGHALALANRQPEVVQAIEMGLERYRRQLPSRQ